MKKKKILLLGGSFAQLPAIKMAKKMGLHTILCDYLPDNPGQNFSDEYINASTTDKEHILEIAKEKQIDYVLAYASDPAALTAAYVSEELGLPGNSYQSVKTLSEKHLFRELLRDIGLNCPKVKSITGDEIDNISELEMEYPLVVKPVDSSGSKGVKLIRAITEFKEAASYALSFSRKNRIIIEEYIAAKGAQLHGDGFVVDDELIFSCLGDHHYDATINPFVPYSTTWPANISEDILDRINRDLNFLIKRSGFKTGAINIEVRVTNEDEIFIMEIGPRSGGNFTPQVIEYATGFNMVEAALRAAIGEKIEIGKLFRKFSSYYVLHSGKNGTLKKIAIDPKIYSYIKEKHQYTEVGEEVTSFQGANAAIGILLMVFPTKEEMEDVMCDIEQHIKIEVE
ncbi:ATP-grasp domain-containing protein [Rhodohalobacter sp.]|uniref:ATP-grasp domain-containing protein n=1 Tax=Rhodohalobacter sp. TaxID=1974210 RepID=UPI002ACECCF5|nr:ATP-grasp domain-containing protein [Rhodohalobacter sp.]MDZ7755177.1 ATP-grasp domain-containing protein [Rhodohalobacter sp.]